jgi:hypothetical protein
MLIEALVLVCVYTTVGSGTGEVVLGMRAAGGIIYRRKAQGRHCRLECAIDRE